MKKVTENSTLSKLLLVKEINKVIETENVFFQKSFSNSLKKAELFYKASESYKLSEVKDELHKINVVFKDKYDYFEQMYNLKKTQTSVLIKVGKLDNEVIQNYLQSTSAPTIDKLIKFIKDGKETETNETAEGISEESKKEKPKKFTTDKKGIEIKINSGITPEDIKQALEYLNTLMVTPTTNVA
jgi:hypothetical protein